MHVTLTMQGRESKPHNMPLQAALVTALTPFNYHLARITLNVWGDSGNIMTLHAPGATVRFEAVNVDEHIITYLTSALHDWHATRRRFGKPRLKPTAAQLVGQHMQKRAGLSPADTRLDECSVHELAQIMTSVGHRVNANPEEVFAAL